MLSMNGTQSNYNKKIVFSYFLCCTKEKIARQKTK